MRGGARVRLAVYLKALACNIKRMLSALQAWEAADEVFVAVPA